MRIQTVDVQIGVMPGFFTNCYIVEADEPTGSVLVIDPANKIEQIAQAIGSRKVEAIVLTHRHDDHHAACSQLQELTGAKVYAHELDKRAIEEHSGHYPKFIRETRKPPIVDLTFKEGDVLQVAGLSLKILHTPGHSAGSVCLYSEDQKVLFSGDTLFYGTCGRTDLPSGDPWEMHNSLARLANLADDVQVYPGHDQPTTIGKERFRALIEY